MATPSSPTTFFFTARTTTKLSTGMTRNAPRHALERAIDAYAYFYAESSPGRGYKAEFGRI